MIRDKGGRRTYSEFHIGWLDVMERLRFTGMPVAQIRSMPLSSKKEVGR